MTINGTAFINMMIQFRLLPSLLNLTKHLSNICSGKIVQNVKMHVFLENKSLF